MENGQSNSNRVHPEVNTGGLRFANQRPEASRKFAALAKTRLNEQYFYEKECDQICNVKGTNSCQCGLPVDEHSVEVQKKSWAEKWDSKACTKKTKWRCFGNIRFKNQDTMNSNSPYIRINDDVDVNQLVELLHMRWKLSKPSLIISVTGGAADFAMKKKDHDRLRQGLQRVAATKGAWVITGGTNAGIMKICGEAVRDQLLTSTSSPSSTNSAHQVVTIGIATWGSIKGKESLIPPEDHDTTSGSVFEAQYQKPFIGTGLDPNHTHFIFADDGSKNQFGKEQGLRGKFESVVRENGVAKEGTPVPIVCVMVEGGPGTIDTVRHALMNETPCVIIDGSGRGADVLAYAVKIAEKLRVTDTMSPDEKSDIEEKKKNLISSKAESVLKLKGPALEKNVNWLIECLKYTSKIRIFKLDEEDGESAGDLDKAILQTLLEMGGLDVRTQLHLSLLWNRDDMAEEVIAKNKKNLDSRDLEEFLAQALVDNKLDFVKLFVDRVPLACFLTKSRLEELYYDTMQVSNNNFLLETLETFEGKERKSKRTLDDIQNALLMKANVPYCARYYSKEQKQTNKSSSKRGQVLGLLVNSSSSVLKQVKDPNSQVNWDQFEDPERELFVYSLLFMRHDMSVYFWEDMLSKTSGALFAMVMTKAMLESSSVKVDINLQNLVESMQKDFQEKGIGILNTCYAVNSKTSHTMLKVQHDCWGEKTCLDLAEKADAKSFIAQSGCQTLVREVWLGKISDRNSTWKIILAALAPFLVYSIWFKSDVKKELRNLENVRKQGESSLESARDQNYNPGATSKSSIGFSTSTDESILVGRESEESLGATVDNTQDEISFTDRYKFFYKAPIVTFILNVVSNLVLLVLLSYVVMAGLDETPHIVELVTIFWLFSLAVEEVRQFMIIVEPTLQKKVKIFLENRWNIVDGIGLLSFLPGLVMRTQPSWDLLSVAHGFYVMSLIVFFIRFTSVFSMHNNLGPKIVMIAKMINDLSFFMFIALVYILAYGIAVQALIYPGVKSPAFSIPWGIFFRPYFEMLGEPNFEEVGATHFDNCVDGSEALWPYEDCPAEKKSIFAVVLKALYMLFTNVLLLNLLIAIFNNRYDAVNEQANIYWKFQVFEVIKEFYNRPWLPPPFIIFSHLYTFGNMLKRRETPKMKRLTEEPKDAKKLEKWEDIRAKEYASLTDRRLQENIEERVRKIEGKSVTIDRTASQIQGELMDIRLNLTDQKNASSTSKDFYEESKQLMERELTGIREENGSVINRMEALENRFEQLTQSFAQVISLVSQIDDRGQRLEDNMTMLLRQFANPPPPLSVEDLEMER